MSRAMAAQNGEDFVEAQNIRDVLRDRLNALRQVKQAQEYRAQQSDARPAEQPTGWQPTKEQVFNARTFLSRHPWYQINGRDEDSRTVTSIDNEMMAEGGNPSAAEYWMELERRINEELPHRALKRQQGGGEPPRGGNGGAGGPRLPGGGGSGGAGGVQKFHLSAARKQALIDLGVYDDPEKRMKHIRRFIEWDKANPTKQ